MLMAMSFCSHCNERIPEGSISCKYCGTLTNQAGGSSAAPAAIAEPAKSSAKLWIISIVIIVVLAVLVVLLALS
ncbi:zinc-ribbon domain-containing protein [Paenibacillus puerhi]|uniref:zinc-ribbon domain-containing protein n=1 Tax=Paenibacillus puerhi TaxID=2692622 RepID=UPI001358ED9F|nr:zinc-ribbon domain-containing protein [Paenibacillus puerhi]